VSFIELINKKQFFIDAEKWLELIAVLIRVFFESFQQASGDENLVI